MNRQIAQLLEELADTIDVAVDDFANQIGKEEIPLYLPKAFAEQLPVAFGQLGQIVKFFNAVVDYLNTEVQDND